MRVVFIIFLIKFSSIHPRLRERGFLEDFLIKLLTNMDSLEPQLFSGIGFSTDGLSARFASEGEAIERATWMYGALWNSASFFKRASRGVKKVPSITFPALSSNGDRLDIPAEAIFYYPKKRQFLKHHSVTTGWAFHSTKEEALAQGYREVIERDLQMLFWFGRLSSYLHKLPLTLVESWTEEYGVSKKQLQSKNSKLYLVQLEVKLHPSMGKKGYFTLAIVVSNEAPYLSVGSALKTSSKASFSTAMGEMIMLRSYQYDLVLRGTLKSLVFSKEEFDFNALVLVGYHTSAGTPKYKEELNTKFAQLEQGIFLQALHSELSYKNVPNHLQGGLRLENLSVQLPWDIHRISGLVV